MDADEDGICKFIRERGAIFQGDKYVVFASEDDFSAAGGEDFAEFLRDL